MEVFAEVHPFHSDGGGYMWWNVVMVHCIYTINFRKCIQFDMKLNHASESQYFVIQRLRLVESNSYYV